MRVQTHTEEAGEERAGEDGALAKEDTRGDCRFVAAPELDDDEDDDHKPEAEEQSPDLGGLPWVLCPAPLKCEQEADYCADEEYGADNIDFGDFLAETEVIRLALRRREEEGDGDECTGTKWKIDLQEEKHEGSEIECTRRNKGRT